MIHEPLGDSTNIRAEPRAAGERVGIDAAVDLATPVRQIVVFPTTVRGKQVRGAGERGGVEAPVAQGVERPRRRRPWLARAVGRLRAAEVKPAREERTARPLAVRILQREQLRAEPLRGDPGTSGTPRLPSPVREV